MRSVGRRSDPDAVVRNSLTVSAWTIVSRLTGFARVAVIAAVLGPTYFGNMFQAMNEVPNLAYALLTGTLFASFLVPPLVRRIDAGDRTATERFAGGFLGITLAAAVVLVPIAILAGPLLLRLFTLGVRDPAAAEAQRRLGWLLLVMVIPQAALYCTASIGAAVMNAHGRFSLAAAAPALENLGLIVTLAVAGAAFGLGRDVTEVHNGEIVLVGSGATAAVALHAAAQWWGAWRVGVRLVPRAGWRDPEVREVIRRAVPAFGYVWLEALVYFAMLITANRVRGGVVAVQLALNFHFLPVAVAAEPVATALRPRLARLYLEERFQAFRDELVRSVAVVLFLTVPAAVALVVLADPLAQAVSLGAMASGPGRMLVAASLATVALGLVGEAIFRVATAASYAREDARSPFDAMLLRAVLTVVLMTPALFAHGTAVVIWIGGAITGGALIGAAQLGLRIAARLPHHGERLTPALVRTVGASLVMSGPAFFVARHPLGPTGRVPASLGAVALASVVGVAAFAGVQWVLRAPELHALARAWSTRSVSERVAGADGA